MPPEIKKIIASLENCEGMRPDQECEKIHETGLCMGFQIACDDCPLENVTVMLSLIKS